MKTGKIFIYLIIVCMLGNTAKSQDLEMKQSFKLALVQMSVLGGDREANLKHALDQIREAAKNGANLVLLPEAMDLGWTHPSALTEAQPIPDGKTCRVLREAAKKYSIFVCSGLIEKADDAVYNSAVLIDPDGEVILQHRKINELDIGHPYYALGDRLNVVETKLGRIGLFICADANTPDQVLTRSLAFMGADIILSPSSWAVQKDHDNHEDPYGGLWKDAYQPVARDFAVWIVSCSNVGWMTDGPWKDWKGIGCSLVVDHQGKVVLQGPYGVDADTILYVDVQPAERPAQGTDWPGYWQILKNQ